MSMPHERENLAPNSSGIPTAPLSQIPRHRLTDPPTSNAAANSIEFQEGVVLGGMHTGEVIDPSDSERETGGSRVILLLGDNVPGPSQETEGIHAIPIGAVDSPGQLSEDHEYPPPMDIKGKTVDPSEQPGKMVSINTHVLNQNPPQLQLQPIASPSTNHLTNVSEVPRPTLLNSPMSTNSVAPEDPPLAKPEYPPLPQALAINALGNPSDDSSVEPWVNHRTWFPRITPYRLFNLLIPAVLNTAKAVVAQSGSQTLPITLEWVSGVVVFLVLTFSGEYDSESHHHLPKYVSWIFKFDCMDAIWAPLETLFTIQRPSYTSSEYIPEHSGTVVTLYRLLVTGATLAFGVTKANLAYSGYAGGANWVDWSYGVIVTSILYFLGLYENNSAGILRPLFVEDSRHFLTLRPKGFPLVIASICTIIILSVQIAPVFREDDYKAPITPILFYPPLLILSLGALGLAVYQWWAIVRRPVARIVHLVLRFFPFTFQSTMHTGTPWQFTSRPPFIPNLRAIVEISGFLLYNLITIFALYIMMFDSQDKLMPKAMRILTETMAILWLATSWFIFAGGWVEECMFDWWPVRGLRHGLPERGVITLIIEPTEPNGQRVLRHQISNWRVVCLDCIVILLHISLSLVFVTLIGGLIVCVFRFEEKAYFALKVPALIMLVFLFPFTCWGIVKVFLPPLLAQMALAFSVTDLLHWATLALLEEVFDTEDFFYFVRKSWM